MNELKKLFTKKAVLMFCCVSILPYVLAALPKGIIVVALTITVIGALIGFKTMKTACAEVYSMCTNLYQRIKKIATMSEEDFNTHFEQGEERKVAKQQADAPPSQPVEQPAQQPVAPRRGSGIPGCCLVKSVTEEQAQTLAREWWEHADASGTSGRNRVEDLIQEISAASPQTHTCQLGDFAQQLSFPKEEKVLYALQQVMKEDGLCADYNDDGYYVIFWGQDTNGKEAGQF